MSDPQQTKDHILDAATRVFAEKGYGGTRMDDVVAAAGLSKGTLYWHYKSKDGLVAAILRRLLSVELRRMQGITAECGSARDGLLAAVDHLTHSLRAAAPLMPLSLEFYAMATRRDWVRRVMRDFYAEYRGVLAAVLQAGIGRGEFRPVPLQETAVTLTALIEGVILLWVIDGDVVDLEQQARAGLGLLLDGLRPRP